MSSHFTLGPSPFDAEHTSLVQRLTSLHDEIGRLTAEATSVQQQIEDTLHKKQGWEKDETARLQREEEERIRVEEEERRRKAEAERLERERLERERLEKERLEKVRLEEERVERERFEKAEQERIARERAETEARLEAEKVAKQAEKERLEREWLEREKQEQLIRETNERKRKETEAALAAASAGVIAAQSHSATVAAAGGASEAPKELHVRAKALYDLDGDETNDELSFVTGDVFTVSGEMNGWMSARHERTGKVGLVPSNYIQIIEQLPLTATTAAAETKEATTETKENIATLTPLTTTTTTTTATTTTGKAGAAVKGRGKGESVIALFDFAGENDDEISFVAGQRLWKTGEVNGWYIGTIDGSDRVGIFPSNFVEPASTDSTTDKSIADSEEVSGGKMYGGGVSPNSSDRDDMYQRAMPLSAAPPHVSRTKSTAFAAAEVATLAQMAADSQAPDTPRTSIGGGRPSLPAAGVAVGGVEPDAIALYRFTATSNDQLSFDKDAKLLIKATLNGWYVGQEIGREALGIFPANYVQKIEKSEAVSAAAVVKGEESGSGKVGSVVVDDDSNGSEQSYRYQQRNTTLDTPLSSTATTTTIPTTSTTATTQQTTAASEASVVIGRVTALYDFHSTTAENLSFNKNDEIAVVKEIKGWWAGSVVGREGKLGLVPSNYCTALRPEPAVAGGLGAVGGQYLVGSASGGLVKEMKVEQVITVGQGQGQVGQSPALVSSTTTQAAPISSGITTASVSSPSAARMSGGSAPPPLSAKPALLSSLATQANGSQHNLLSGSRPSLQPVQSTQTVQSAPHSISQPIAVIEPTATSATSNGTTSMITTATTPATASTPALTTTHSPPIVVAAPNTTTHTTQPTTTTTTTTASSATPGIVAAATAAQSAFVRQPTDKVAIAEHDWETSERGELSFKKDDRIIVTREKNGWFTGYVEGTAKKGMFPSTFVRMLPAEGGASSGEKVGAAVPSTVVAASIAPTVTNTPSTSRPPSPTHSHHSHQPSISLSSNSANQQPLTAPTTTTSASSAATADPSTHPALIQLERGVQVTKLDSHGYPKTTRMFIEREKLSRGKRGEWVIRWDTKKFNKREAQLTLAKCRVKRGLRSQQSGGSGVQNAFTVLSPLRNLQVICANEGDREMWMDAFAVLNVEFVDEGTSGTASREPSMKRATTPAPATAVTVVDREEVVSIHDVLAQGPPANESHVKVGDGMVTMAGTNKPVTTGMVVAHQQPMQQHIQQQVQTVQPQRFQQQTATGNARIVQALYDFGSEAEDLPMVAGDRIELMEANPDEQWWRGRNLTKPGNRVGMFPRSYVSELTVEPVTVLKPIASHTSISSMSVGGNNSRPSSRASMNGAVTSLPTTATTAATAAAPTSFTPITTIAPPSSSLAAAVGGGHSKVRALYDFETDLVQHPNDLPFKQGEVLTLLSKDNEWWTGVDSRGRKGMFPATFVKEMV